MKITCHLTDGTKATTNLPQVRSLDRAADLISQAAREGTYMGDSLKIVFARHIVAIEPADPA